MKKTILSLSICLLANIAFSQNFTFTASRQYQSSNASGDYTIISNNANTLNQVDKPIIIVEGFDNSNEISGSITHNMYSIQPTNYLSYQLRDLGYDIIVLNF
ncbi:MAG: hypothetical protein ACOYMA_14080, partial [Bacteroidia bacterium]